ncbi:MAG: ATP-dependent DNA helicase [Sulfolobaceae archaeon]
MKLRDWQARLKDKVINALKEEYIVALQSPTGSGKTLFSLLVGLELKGKVLFVVRTHNEYYPIYREYMRVARDKKFGFVMGKPISCIFASSDANPEDIKCSSCEYQSVLNNYEIKDPPHEEIFKLKEQGYREGFCPYYTLLENIRESDVVVISYPYFFLPNLRSLIDVKLEEYLIVIDEAHNLDSINELDERRISKRTIEGALREVSSEEAKRILTKLEEEFSKRVYKEERHILVDKITNITQEEIEILDAEYEELKEKMLKEGKIKRLNLGSIIKFLKSLNEEGRSLFSYSEGLVSKVIDSSKYLEILNDEKLSILLMSGTLPPKEYLENIIGIKRKIFYIDVEKETRSKVSGNYECIIATDVTTAYSLRNERMWKNYASYILKIYYNSKKNILVVFPSYEIMNKILSLITNIPKYIESENSTIEEAQKIISNSHDKMIIGIVSRGKLSEGVEFRINNENLISDVVIVGIPYPPPDDYMKVKSELISKRLGYEVNESLYRIPAMISVKQAIGRAIRDINDRVTVWLLDKRFEGIWWKQKLKCFNSKKIRL